MANAVTVYNYTSVRIHVGSSYNVYSGGSTTCYYNSGTSVSIYGYSNRYLRAGIGGYPSSSRSSISTTHTITWPSSGSIYVFEYGEFVYDPEDYIDASWPNGYYIRSDQSYELTANDHGDYTFSYWSGSSSSTSRTISGTIGYLDYDFTAHYTYSPTYNYYLRFSANGGSGAPGTLSGSSKASYYTFTVPTTEPTRSSYTFKGWAWDGSSTTADVQPGTQVQLSSSNADRTLYAVWSLDVVGISVTNATNVSVNVGSSYSIPRQDIETCYYSPGSTVTISASVPLTSDGSTSYTITWPSSGTITINQYSKLTFAGNYGGSVTGDHTSGSYLAYNTSVTLTAIPNSGYEFYNWNDGTTDSPYSFNMGWDDVNLIANFKQYHTIKIQLRDSTGVITEHATGTYVDKTTGTSIAPGIDTKVYDGDEIYLLASSFDQHYHLVEWKSYDTGVIYSTSNPYTFNITSDMNITGVVDTYTEHTLSFTRMKDGVATIDWEGVWFTVWQYNSTGEVIKTTDVNGSSTTVSYYGDEKLTIRVKSGADKCMFDNAYDPATGTYYSVGVYGQFDIEPGDRNLALQFSCHWENAIVSANMQPYIAGTVTIKYFVYDSNTGTYVLHATSTSDGEDYAQITMDRETYPKGYVIASYVITKTDEGYKWEYWDLYNVNAATHFYYSAYYYQWNIILEYGDTSQSFSVAGYHDYRLWANVIRTYTYKVTSSGDRGTSTAYLVLPDGSHPLSFDYYLNETVQLGVTCADGYEFVGWQFSNMKDPSDLDAGNENLSFKANDNHGPLDSFITDWVDIFALFQPAGTNKGYLSYSNNLGGLGGDVGTYSTDKKTWLPFSSGAVEFAVGTVVTVRTTYEIKTTTSTILFKEWEDGSTYNERTITIAQGSTSIIATYETTPGPGMTALMLLSLMLDSDDKRKALGTIIKLGKYLL